MTELFNVVRSSILPLAAPDPLLEDVQDATTFQGNALIASPPKQIADGGKEVEELELVVYAFTAGTPPAPVAGTCTFQFVEIAPVPEGQAASYPTPFMYVGRAPIANHPMGRSVFVPARYLQQFTVLLSNIVAAGADQIRVLWRTYR